MIKMKKEEKKDAVMRDRIETILNKIEIEYSHRGTPVIPFIELNKALDKIMAVVKSST